MAETASKRQRLSDGGAPKKTQFTCQLCAKSYERADHLTRHLDSHRDERTFKCSECPRAFNRRDLLLRHQATHSNSSNRTKPSSDRAAERAIRACDACVLSKLKCGNTRPCKRCQERGIPCNTQSLGRRNTHSEHVEESHAGDPQNLNGLRTPESGASQKPNTNAVIDEQLLPNPDLVPAPVNQPFPDAVSWPAATPHANVFDFPSFFEHIMDPDPNFGLTDSVQMPPELSTLMPNQDWYSEIDIFGMEFTPTIDQAIGSISSYGFPESNNAESISSAKDASDANQTAGRRHLIYQQSPWLWRPDVNQNAFSEDNNIPLDDQTVHTATSPQPRLLPSPATQDRLSAHTRDKIFRLVIKIGHAHLNIPSFPSANCLDTLLKVGIAQKAERDAWFHPFSFSIETARPELLVAMIAAGCVCFNISSISKTGLVLFEVAHAALSRLFEDDNSVIRDLQYLQAFMSWLDTCAFCGFTRKMEIAEANLQPLVTALRRWGKFDRAAYPPISLRPEDEGESLDLKWRRWVEQESYKRLVHHVFKHDIYMTTTKVRNPVISYAEMSLPLPDNRELWFAPTAAAWKALYLGNSNSNQRHTTSLCEILANNDLVKCLPASADSRLAKKAYVYGLAALTWEHSQQTKLFNTVDASTNPLARLWLQSRYQHLYETLQNYSPGLRPDSPSLRILHEFLMMSFHVSPETVTSFAGKCGEEEAHRAYKELQIWVQTKPARLAVWHGAQVLRAARRVRSHHLRGADAFIIRGCSTIFKCCSSYDTNSGVDHAVMVIWAYSMLQQDAARKAGINTPLHGAPAERGSFLGEINDDDIVFLDVDSSSKTNAFIMTGAGRPFLQLGAIVGADTAQQSEQPGPYNLRHPQQVLGAGVRVLEGTFPKETREQLPPLIKSFCDLMDLIASLR